LAQAEVDSRVNTFLLAGIAANVTLVHLLTNHSYGLHRDELQVLSDARHLDWGFVPRLAWPEFWKVYQAFG